MQSEEVTSRPRRTVLSRSRSLASPLTDIDYVGSPATHVTESPRCSGKKSNGFVSSMLIVESGSTEEDEEDNLEDLCEPGTHPTRSPMRQQRSLAELFGMAVYKSKLHLHEFFSRRPKPGETLRKTGNGSVSSCRLFVETKTSEVSGSERPNLEAGAWAEVSAPTTFTAGSQTTERSKLIPRESHANGSKNRNAHNLNKTVMKRLPRSRVPEELFCVTRNVHPADKSGISPDKNVLLSHTDAFKNSSPLQADSNGFTFYYGSKPRTASTKSPPDKFCDPKSAPDACLSKASSDVAAHRSSRSFVSRTPTSRLLPSRDGKVGVVTTDSTSSPSVLEAGCISRVVDGLWLGSVEAAYNEPLLCSLKVDAIVDITNLDPLVVPAEKKSTCPCACKKPHFRTKLKVAVDDIEWENIDLYFADANAFINGWRQRGSRVLAVSYHGKSRAPAFVVQYLMHHYHTPLARALAHVRSRRPQTRLNPGFLRVLQRLDRVLAEQRDFSDLSVPQFPPPGEVQACPKTAWDDR